MNCPSCQKDVDPTLAACAYCGCRLQSAARDATILKQPPARRARIQVEVDLATTVDRTGSSQAFAAGIPTTYELILRQLGGKARTIKCWLGSHGDLDEGQDFIMLTNGGTPEQASADIKKITFDGGGDPREHHLDAIATLLNQVPWTLDPLRARGAILAFMTADTKPAKSGISAAELGKQIKAKGILLYLVCENTPALQELASAAGGLLFAISNNPDPAELQLIAAQVSASITCAAGGSGTVPQPV